MLAHLDAAIMCHFKGQVKWWKVAKTERTPKEKRKSSIKTFFAHLLTFKSPSSRQPHYSSKAGQRGMEGLLALTESMLEP